MHDRISCCFFFFVVFSSRVLCASFITNVFFSFLSRLLIYLNILFGCYSSKFYAARSNYTTTNWLTTNIPRSGSVKCQLRNSVLHNRCNVQYIVLWKENLYTHFLTATNSTHHKNYYMLHFQLRLTFRHTHRELHLIFQSFCWSSTHQQFLAYTQTAFTYECVNLNIKHALSLHMHNLLNWNSLISKSDEWVRRRTKKTVSSFGARSCCLS